MFSRYKLEKGCLVGTKYPNCQFVAHRQSGDTVLLDLFRPSSPGSDTDSASSSRRSSVANVEGRRMSREEEQQDVGERDGEDKARVGGEEEGTSDGKSGQQEDRVSRQKHEKGHTNENKNRTKEQNLDRRSDKPHGKEVRTRNEVAPCAQSGAGWPLRRTSNGSESSEVRLAPLEEAEEPEGSSSGSRDAAGPSRRLSYPPVGEPQPKQARREERCFSVPRILVYRPDGVSASFVGSGTGNGTEGTHGLSKSGGGGEQGDMDQVSSKNARQSQESLGSARGEQEIEGLQSSEECQLTSVATELAKKVIQEALKVRAKDASPVGSIDDATQLSEEKSDASNPSTSPSTTNESPARSDALRRIAGDHDATSSPSLNEPIPADKHSTHLTESDADPLRTPRPDTPINEVALRRYGASCRPRQQVVVSARRPPAGPPEPCGRLVAQRRARFEPPPDQIEANPGPRPGYPRVRSWPDRAQGHSGSSTSGKTPKERDQSNSTASSLCEKTVPKHVSTKANRPTSKETPQQLVISPASSARESRNNSRQEACVKKQTLPASGDEVAVSKAIGVVDDSFREILDELTTDETSGDDPGRGREMDTADDGKHAERGNCQGAARTPVHSKGRNRDFHASVTDAAGNCSSSQKSAAKKSGGQESARLVGFGDKHIAAPSQTEGSRSQAESSSVKSPCVTARGLTSPIPDPTNRRDLGSCRVDIHQQESRAAALPRTATAAGSDRGGRLVAGSDRAVPAPRPVPASAVSDATESSEEEEDGADDQELHRWITQVRIGTGDRNSMVFCEKAIGHL